CVRAHRLARRGGGKDAHHVGLFRTGVAQRWAGLCRRHHCFPLAGCVEVPAWKHVTNEAFTHPPYHIARGKAAVATITTLEETDGVSTMLRVGTMLREGLAHWGKQHDHRATQSGRCSFPVPVPPPASVNMDVTRGATRSA